MLFVYIISPILVLLAGNILFINAIQQGLIYFNKPAKLGRPEKFAIGTFTTLAFIIIIQLLDFSIVISVTIGLGFIFIALLALIVFRTLNQ